jgi:hypothetical protein
LNGVSGSWVKKGNAKPSRFWMKKTSRGAVFLQGYLLAINVKFPLTILPVNGYKNSLLRQAQTFSSMGVLAI